MTDLAPISSIPDERMETATRAFLRALDGRYVVRDSILFGSRARRTNHADSDADLAVILRGRAGDRAATAREMAAIAFDVMLETGMLVEALPIWEDEFDRPETFANPLLLRSIRRDGLRMAPPS